MSPLLIAYFPLFKNLSQNSNQQKQHKTALDAEIINCLFSRTKRIKVIAAQYWLSKKQKPVGSPLAISSTNRTFIGSQFPLGLFVFAVSVSCTHSMYTTHILTKTVKSFLLTQKSHTQNALSHVNSNKIKAREREQRNVYIMCIYRTKITTRSPSVFMSYSLFQCDNFSRIFQVSSFIHRSIGTCVITQIEHNGCRLIFKNVIWTDSTPFDQNTITGRIIQN